MTTTTARSLPLAAAIWPVNDNTRVLRAVVLMVVGSLLLTVSAKIMVPFWPVQMSMQTFAVLLIAAAYGSRLGCATVALYLAQGALGLPVFGLGGGIAYLAGPTGGYLIGYFFAAFVIGWMVERGYGHKMLTALAAFLVGEIILFTFGVGWLAYLIGFDRAIAGGLLPFLPAEALKVALAVALLPFAWRLVERFGR